MDHIGPRLDRILETVEQPARLAGNVIVTGASIGVTTSTPGDETIGLLRRADVAMYAAQAARLHENGYHLAQGYLFGRPMTADAFEELFIAADVAAPVPG